MLKLIAESSLPNRLHRLVQRSLIDLIKGASPNNVSYRVTPNRALHDRLLAFWVETTSRLDSLSDHPV
ncbi:hypothetical protein PCASD_25906 [Puccinia coronata f. sp. avenae]|uniref:Uncharacterized protein n=1 Tax=Puccinia coronata f. sp. avenae TaxID=200324 RepID=A0A2N5THI3_9BASI|nr:hypothetical protein PCASD_25906 [Puccinia coronata f. sp. avenae]